MELGSGMGRATSPHFGTVPIVIRDDRNEAAPLVVEAHAEFPIGETLNLEDKFSYLKSGREIDLEIAVRLFPLLEHADLAHERVTCAIADALLAGILHVLQCNTPPTRGKPSEECGT